jgi:hypothetical protein
MKHRSAIIWLAVMMLAACQRDVTEQVAELTGRLFVFNYREATANYLITLKATAPLPEGAFAEAEFENPRGGAPLSVRQKLFPAMEKIVLESPHLQCVRKGHRYKVTIRLLEADGRTIQTIETSVASDVDQSVLPAKPLVVGPLYTPNPDVFKADGSADFSPEDCPA